jgi:replicative DNA helicase
MGKSAFTLGLVRAVAVVGPVLVCTLEDSNSMLISRQVASAGRANLADIRSPQHAPESMWAAVTDAVSELGPMRIYVDDQAGLSLQQVVQKARYVQSKEAGLAMVVVDYLQLMDDAGESRAYELANITRGLKRMAKELDCVVVLLSQLSREADKTNVPPRLDHLAESGAIEQASDIVGLLWRESRRSPKPGNENTAQLELVKNKNGPTKTVQLFFDGARQRFDNLSFGGSEDGAYS